MFELRPLALIYDQGFPSINVLEDRRKVLGAAHVVIRGDEDMERETGSTSSRLRVSQLVPFDDFTTLRFAIKKEPPRLLENL